MKKLSKLLTALFTGATPSRMTHRRNCALPGRNEHDPHRRKCVYISPSVHAVLSRIVSLDADTALTIGKLADTVLSDYLEANKEEINTLYRRDRGDLIQ
jgi:hypothetical protein